MDGRMKELRIGIIGAGSIGSTHVQRFVTHQIQHARLTGICDTDPAVIARYPDIPTWTDYRAFIDSGELDAVIVATPHFSHVPIGMYALEKGLHVLMEKPVAVHKADALRLLEAHTDKKLVFAAMFDTRTEPRYQKVRELIQAGELGTIRRINWILTAWFRSNAYYASSLWRATWAGEGGGMLVNQLPHDLDLFQWIFGLPKRVRAFCPLGKYHPIEVEDEVNALLEFENGATAVLVATTGEAPGTDRREIIGDRGRLVIHNDYLEFTRNEVPTDEFNRTTRERFGAPNSWEVKIPIKGQAGRHTEVIQKFVGAIREGTPLVAGAYEGLASIELANAITLASALDKTIELPLDAKQYEVFLREKIAASIPKTEVVESAPVDMSKSFQ